MKISKIKIENFRSIRHTKFTTTGFNIYVGQNNCGKTNFFEALEFFYNGLGKGVSLDELKYKRNNQNEILVKVEFTGALACVEKMQNEKNKATMQGKLNGNDIVVFTRDSKDVKKRKMYINDTEIQPGTGFDTALNDFLPKFEYINTKQYYDSVAKYAKTTPIGIMLSGVLSTILQSNQQYKDFQSKFSELFESDTSQIKTEFETIGNQVKIHLEKQFPDTTKVKFEVSAPAFDDLLKNFSTAIDDGVETSAEEKGDGMQRALMLAIIQAYSDFRRKSEDVGKSFLFFIDEAELHLHPTAQRNLKNVLHSLSQDTDQVFINTHSSVFVADNYENQSIFKVEKSDGETEIEKISDNEKPYIVFELLGGSPSDLLLPKNFLIVEGQSEFELLTRVIKRFYSDKPIIQIVKANGDIDQAERTINAIEKVFAPLNLSIYKDKLILLLDKPSQQTEGGVNQFKQNNKHLEQNNQIFILPKRDIEQCYPNQKCSVYGNWQKSQNDVDAMNGKKKKQLAKYIGENIIQQQFESDLKYCFNALQKCWELSF
ncbi:MAG: ATP-binding protein [Planctomycetaceae bacterium]|jgi:predicted ATP-dependent endonuclease of OLD family|nr:ATP-binding protein [Planctomycetaceae bacterium]